MPSSSNPPLSFLSFLCSQAKNKILSKFLVTWVFSQWSFYSSFICLPSWHCCSEKLCSLVCLFLRDIEVLKSKLSASEQYSCLLSPSAVTPGLRTWLQLVSIIFLIVSSQFIALLPLLRKSFHNHLIDALSSIPRIKNASFSNYNILFLPPPPN